MNIAGSGFIGARLVEKLAAGAVDSLARIAMRDFFGRITAALLGWCCIATGAQTSNLPEALLQEPIHLIAGQQTSLADFRGRKPVYLKFWATWCTPCKKELDAIAKKYDQWQSDYGVELVAVTIDDQRALPRVKPMVNEKRWKYTVLSDVKQDFQHAMNVQTIPHTFVVKDGKIVYSHNGYLPGDENELETKLKSL